MQACNFKEDSWGNSHQTNNYRFERSERGSHVNVQGVLEPQVKKALAKALGQTTQAQAKMKTKLLPAHLVIILSHWCFRSMKSKESNHAQDNTVHRQASGCRRGSEDGRELHRQWSGVMLLGRSELQCGVTQEKHASPPKLEKAHLFLKGVLI